MPSIFDSKIDRLSNPISDLKDEPDMNAAELKAYFDASPMELLNKHNELADALLSRGAAKEIGFTATSSVPAGNIQDAIDYVIRHSSGSGGSISVSNIGRSQLGRELINELDGYAALEDSIEVLSARVSDLSERVRKLGV